MWLYRTQRFMMCAWRPWKHFRRLSASTHPGLSSNNFIVKTSPRTLICSTTHHDRFDTAQRAATNLSSASCRCFSAHVDHLHATCGGALSGTRATVDQRRAQAQEAWRYGLAHLARGHSTMTDSCTKDTEILERTSHTC